ncbi:MAG: hypothetical protein K2Q18_10225 [Bdellovibrionales bacterium]|nr:hypothetical protein [Bdellovibrionales bacterium]
MKFLLTIILSCVSLAAIAKTPLFLAKYSDCVNSTNIVSDNLPIFLRVNGKKLEKKFKAKLFTDGIDISLVTNTDGDIKNIFFGDFMSLNVAGMEYGLEFGILNFTAHTVQIVNFNPKYGGILEFGYLKSFGASKEKRIKYQSETLNEYFTSVYGENWGTFKLNLTKDQETNTWKLQNSEEKTVASIYGIMQLKGKIFVNGISSMISLDRVPTPISGMLKIPSGKKSYECEITN